MSIFFSSGIKTLWSSFSAFVLYEAAQWGWETHTTLRRSSVVLPTECPTNYQVQTRSYHSVFAAILWFGQCLYPLFSLSLSLSLSLSVSLFSNWASNRDGCWSRRVTSSHRWRGKYSNLKLSLVAFSLLHWQRGVNKTDREQVKVGCCSLLVHCLNLSCVHDRLDHWQLIRKSKCCKNLQKAIYFNHVWRQKNLINLNTCFPTSLVEMSHSWRKS